MARPTRAAKLYSKSESAMIAAIEVYNKPTFAYREETFSILAINAWELLLKARVLSQNLNNLRSIYVLEHKQLADGSTSARKFPRLNRAGNHTTIGLFAAIAKLEATTDTRLPTEVRGNIEALLEVRDNAVHFENAGFPLAKHVLEIGTASVRNYVELAKRWFSQDLSKYNLYLMPIGFLATPSATGIAVGGSEGKLVSYLRNLSAAQNTTSASSSSAYHIALDVNLKFKRTATNAVSTFALTNDPTAPHVILTEEDILARYPWDYKALLAACRLRYVNFKENSAFHERRNPLLEDKRYALHRFLDPRNPKSSKKVFYSPGILAQFDSLFTLA